MKSLKKKKPPTLKFKGFPRIRALEGDDDDEKEDGDYA